ncbi:beta-lactamase related protein [Anaeramoeba flamelloides]|uniref:Beta-lactamase related protein n=1 Tax=Anaeramoeba flamelloides TaxID=1746091 RepID=A0AAV8AD11_9EUKA|nr:beta-lactamase related protein [Anaeramoeba flamelloides]
MLQIIKQLPKGPSTQVAKNFTRSFNRFLDSSSDQVVTIDTHYEDMRYRAASYLLKTVNDPKDVHGLLIDNNTNNCLETILSTIDSNGIPRTSIDYLIATHIHLDHAGCTSQLVKNLPNATVLVHPRGARHLIDPTKLVRSASQVYGGMENFEKLYGKIEKIPKERVRSINDGETLDFGGRKLKFLYTRGHAKHHMVIHDSYSNAVFAGDAFGIRYPDLCRQKPDNLAVFPSSSPIDFEPELALKAIKDIKSLFPKRIYLTHYGLIDDVETASKNIIEGINNHWKILKAAKKTGLKGDMLYNWTKKRVHSWVVKFVRDKIGDDNEIDWQQLDLDIDLNSQGIAFCAEYK